jgi:hypothetical protein
MKKLARLAGLLSLAILAVGLMTASSASATGYLLLPVGAIITGTSLPGTLTVGNNVIKCEKDNFAGAIASVHLIGPFRVHFLGCTAENTGTGGNKGCEANSKGAAGGLILTEELHALIGLGLPGNLPALLVLPTNGEGIFVELAESTNKTGKCTVATTVEGNVAGLLLQTISTKTTRALLDFTPGDPEKIDLPLGGTVVPAIRAFGAAGKFATVVHLSYNEEAELMP